MALSPHAFRESLIDRLRQELVRVSGEDQSICRVAAEQVQKRERDLCGGCNDFPDEDLLRFYKQLSCTPAFAATADDHHTVH